MDRSPVLDAAAGFARCNGGHQIFGGDTTMQRRVLGLVIGLGLGIGGLAAAHHHHEDGESVKVLSSMNIVEKLDGQAASAAICQPRVTCGKSSRVQTPVTSGSDSKRTPSHQPTHHFLAPSTLSNGPRCHRLSPDIMWQAFRQIVA
ncbi:hypothetical protein [Planctomicrobium piriforme]|nr:hypothetical protein [Planctomicrobium piriforme]